MRRVSKKTQARIDECRELRQQLVREVDRCEVCGHDPKWARPGRIAWSLACHEIANGPLRQKALDKRYALLVTCWRCNSERLTDKKEWPEARQLARLKRSRPQDYDLVAYNKLVGYGPNRVTEEEVRTWEKPR